MEKETSSVPSLVNEVRYISLSRRIKVLGFAIMFGLLVIYAAGLFVASNNINKDLAILNLASLILCSFLSITSVYVRKMMLKSVNSKNFMSRYFTVHIIPFAMCDMGGLFCIATNLFINENIIYASFGALISVIYVFLNFPKHSDMEGINARGKIIDAGRMHQ